MHGCGGHAWLWGASVAARGCAWLPGGVCGCRGGACVVAGGVHRIRRVNERAVRILLECILVENVLFDGRRIVLRILHVSAVVQFGIEFYT